MRSSKSRLVLNLLLVCSIPQTSIRSTTNLQLFLRVNGIRKMTKQKYYSFVYFLEWWPHSNNRPLLRKHFKDLKMLALKTENE